MKDNRTTVKLMRDQLEYLLKNGHGDKYIFVGEFYIGKVFNAEDKYDVTFEEIHYSDIPITKEQQEEADEKVKEFTDNLSEEDKNLLKSFKSKNTVELKEIDITNKYIKYLDKLKSEKMINEEKYQELMKTIKK